MNNQFEGSLTVFYAAIFSGVILMLLALLSYGRVQIMRVGVRKDVDLSAFGVMAEYQKDWVEEYGLYMVPQDKMAGSFSFYLKQNAVHMTGDYVYSDSFVTAEETLAEAEVLEKQILALMKERGWLSLLSEMADLLREGKEESSGADEVFEETGGVEATASLYEIQTVYASLVTDMEGIRNDGLVEAYYVNGLLEKDPTLGEIRILLERMEAEALATESMEEKPEAFQSLSSHEVGELERALFWIEQAEGKCLSAEGKMETLIGLLEELEVTEGGEKAMELLPFTADELDGYCRILRENREYCQEAEEAFGNLINLLDKTPPSYAYVHSLINGALKIESYDTSIDLPYEYRKASRQMDLKGLLRALQGYPDNMAQLAPDEEKDLPEGGIYVGNTEEEKAYGSLNSLDMGEGFESAFLTAEYTLGFFRNFRETVAEGKGEKTENLRGDEKKNRFFNNEVEYVLVGKNSEYKNVNGTRQRLLLLRGTLNMAYLLSDPGKREAINLAAASTGGILLPGVGDLVAFALITTCWSMAEAILDYRTLVEGGEVPFVKTEDSWKTDLEAVLSEAFEEEGEKEAGGIIPMDYEQYLRILLFLIPRETRLGRIQELLYLNHKEFPLEEAVCSFRVYGTASGIGEMDYEAEYGFYH